MAGLRLTLPTTFSDATLPVVHDDLAVPPAVTTGVLGLWEMNHGARPAASGAASGLVIPNVAFKEAAALLGLAGYTASPPAPTAGQITAAQTAVDGTFTTDASYVAGTTATFERTSRGGLHGIVSQVSNTASNQGAALTLPSAIHTYITANPAHAYFMSLWDAISRVGIIPASSQIIAGVLNNASGASNQLFTVTTLGLRMGALGSASLVGANTVGASYSELGASAYSGTVPTAANEKGGVFWGSTTQAGASQNSGQLNKLPSHAFYRLYLEDLTVSGRSFAQAAAADQAAYALAFGTGGRYASDTFTAPSTLP